MSKSEDKRKNKSPFRWTEGTDEFNQIEKDILNKNNEFYSHNVKYIETLLDMIDGNRNQYSISIRLLEWFVINYAEENNVFYIIRSGGVKRPFYVYTEYKNELNGYSKKYFDPFCRKRKIIYSYKVPGKPTITFISSIAQLNFFKWVIKYKIIDYIKSHPEIEKAFREYTKKKNQEKKKSIEEDNTDTKEDVIIEDELCSSEKSIDLCDNCTVPTKRTSCKRQRRKFLSAKSPTIKKSYIELPVHFD